MLSICGATLEIEKQMNNETVVKPKYHVGDTVPIQYEGAEWKGKIIEFLHSEFAVVEFPFRKTTRLVVDLKMK